MAWQPSPSPLLGQASPPVPESLHSLGAHSHCLGPQLLRTPLGQGARPGRVGVGSVTVSGLSWAPRGDHRGPSAPWGTAVAEGTGRTPTFTYWGSPGEEMTARGREAPGDLGRAWNGQTDTCCPEMGGCEGVRARGTRRPFPPWVSLGMVRDELGPSCTGWGRGVEERSDAGSWAGRGLRGTQRPSLGSSGDAVSPGTSRSPNREAGL